MQTIDADRAVAYVRSLEKNEGGFGATRRLPATVEDTFHAVAVFRLLAETGARPEHLVQCRTEARHLAFVAGRWPGEELDLKSVAQLCLTARDLASHLDPAELAPLVDRKLGRSPSLANRYYASLILADSGPAAARQGFDPPPAGNRLATSARHVCQERLMALAVRRAEGAGPDGEERQALITWFRDCQTPDGGFGFLPGTTSFIENCHFCLQALASLGGRPRDRAGVAAFIAGCQTRGGGFGRRGNAAPFLDATYHAVAAQACLREC